MLSLQTVVPDTLELLKRLMAEPLFDGLRLVGGTSLALQYGHRQSVDLDMFGELKGDDKDIEERLAAIANEVSELTTSKSIKIFNLDGVKVDFVNYSRYPWIDDAVEEEGLRLASPKDIAAMKVNAIMGRGSRKDFIDIYFLMQHYTIQEILDFYQEKYPEHNFFRALMSLSYFNDAEAQQMPVMYAHVSWDEMKQYIQHKVAEIK
ncbi:MAG: nucleotidyl transferase AbiEii/AbiGii toxin family protein [Prevotella sp.]|nr:nucleotidyl transferase AbiEii/AbiGii toxin family protein [Prevotella sp.]